MNPGEEDAVRSLLRILAMSGLGGAAAGLGAGALRAANPRYEPPEAPPPVVVDMPVPAQGPGPAGPVPIPSKTKPARPAALPAKAAGFGEWLKSQVSGLGDAVSEYMPTVRHPMGPTGAQTAGDIPAFYAAALPLGAAGAGGGFVLGDRLARAAERRKAQTELDAARKEYQDAVTARTSQLYFPKAAAGVADLLEGRTPADPHLARAKAALDAAWAKRAEGPPVVDPADPTRGADFLSQATQAWLWPGTAMGKGPAAFQMGLLGALGGLGAFSGYRFARNDDAAAAVRRETEKRDRDNAAKLPAPVIARLVPVPTE